MPDAVNPYGLPPNLSPADASTFTAAIDDALTGMVTSQALGNMLRSQKFLKEALSENTVD